MALFEARIGQLKIPSGAAVSNSFTAHLHYGDAVAIIIYGPVSLPETITLQVTDEEDPANPKFTNPNGASPIWLPLKDVAGTAIALPGAGEARTYPSQLQAAMAFRASSGGNVAGDRVWIVSKQVVAHVGF